MNNDTIFALSSGHGKSGVAVIRISGTDLKNTAQAFIRRPAITPRHAYFTNLADRNGDIIDQCVIIYFAGPASFTGEDVIEIHCHGARAVIEKIFSFLSQNNMRMALPGEFSKRAFYNNKMDLSDIDGLAALLDAQTDRQRAFALKSMMGRDSETYQNWRNQMIEISAYAAAILDYDANDLPANIGKTIHQRTENLYNEINDALARYGAVRAVQAGLNITLAGETNVGKSSIFNYLAGTNRAIVSDTPGTTRDVVNATLDIDGYLVNLSDTAGIRDTDNDIEKIGIAKTRTEIENADIIIHVKSADGTNNSTVYKNEILVINKSDITRPNIPGAILVSAKTGDGMDNLLNTIRSKISEKISGADHGVVVNARTKSLLESAACDLGAAINNAGDNYDIFAEHVRRAADSIGKILGTITAADVMDATFSQLCLGK